MNKMVKFLKVTGKSMLRLAGTAASCAGGVAVGKVVYDRTENPTIAGAAGIGTAAVGTVAVNAVIDGFSKPETSASELQHDIDKLSEDTDNLYMTLEEIGNRIDGFVDENTVKELTGICDAHSKVLADHEKRITQNSVTIKSIMESIRDLPAIADTVSTLSDTVFKETIDDIKMESAVSEDSEPDNEQLEKEYGVKANGKNKSRKRK